MNYDPYQPPAIPLPLSSSDGHLSQQATDELLASQGWVRFASVMGFIGSGFMIFSVIVTYFAVNEMSSSRYGNTRSAEGFIAGQLFVMFAIAMLYIYPSVLLAKYASAIKRFRYSRAMPDLAAALRHQRFFWRFVGIIMIIMLAVMLVAMVLGAAGAMFTSSRF